MRDLTQLRLFLLASMGLAQVTGCQQPPAAPAAVPVDVSAAADGDTLSGSDGDADSGPDAAADTTLADAASVDAASVDAASVDAAKDGATDSGPADTLVDTATKDATADIAADAPADTSQDAASDVSVCSFGKPNTECFNAVQLKANIDNPPMGGDSQPTPYSGPLPPLGCPDRKLVLDGCCNSAQTEGVLNGDTCCYTFCTGACCGRPLMVDGVALLAELSNDSPWAKPPEFAAQEIGACTGLAAAWREDAREEHAAIASFHRLGMELLAIGAPPTLVQAAAVAASEEVDHAETCFAWARALDGQHLGPGRLPLGELSLRTDLAAVAVASALEGGVGETLAAAELGLAAALCPDSQRAARLTQMAADESRHAALAWQVVRWALQQEPEAVRPALTQALLEALTQAPAPFRRSAELAGIGPAAAHAAGRLTQAEAESCARQAMAEVVAACACAVLPELRQLTGSHHAYA